MDTMSENQETDVTAEEPASTKIPPGVATKKCIDAVMRFGYRHHHFLIIHAKLRNNYVESKSAGGMGTMAVTSTGKILINPDFVDSLSYDQLAGVMFHEMLHLVLQHIDRCGSRDPLMFNVAADMCINESLRRDDIQLPDKAVYPPNEYDGDLNAEAVYEWLMKQQQQKNKGGDGGSGNESAGSKYGDGSPTSGCGVVQDGQGQSGADDEGQTDWRQVMMEARAIAQHAGMGSSAVSALLSPRKKKISWKKIIKHGFETTAARPMRDWQSFSKRNRRSPTYGPQYPGWLGTEPRIAMVIDVSGSMDREWICQIVAECISLMKTFQGTNVYLVTHTSEVCWEGWINDGTIAKLPQAVSFSGGTDPTPAYEAVAKAGRFDCLIHMTDTEFGQTWPKPPARQCIVGAFTTRISTTPPPGATVIMCDTNRG